MLQCWDANPKQRPTFTELKEDMESIISDGDQYFNFNINENSMYYHVPSFKSVESEDENDEERRLISDNSGN